MSKDLSNPVTFVDGYIINIKSEEDNYGMFRVIIKQEIKKGIVVYVNLNRLMQETANDRLKYIIEKYNKDDILRNVPRDIMREICNIFEDKNL